MNSLVVLDRNLVISAALFKNSVPRFAFDKARTHHTIISSIPCFDELKEVLLRTKFKKYINASEAELFLKLYEKQVQFVPISHTITDCRDPKDNKFLELALSAHSSLIISGDKDLLVLNPYRNVKIISPFEFITNQ